MARSEDHQSERSRAKADDDKDDDKKEETPRRARGDSAVTHADLEAFAEKLMERVRQEIALAASGVPLEERIERNA
jgi:hypothetical protein